MSASTVSVRHNPVTIGQVVGDRKLDRTIVCPRCDVVVMLHKVFWCSEVCHNCLQTFNYGSGADDTLRVGSGFYYGEAERVIRQWIADCGNRYVPRFRNESPAEAIANCA